MNENNTLKYHIDTSVSETKTGFSLSYIMYTRRCRRKQCEYCNSISGEVAISQLPSPKDMIHLLRENCLKNRKPITIYTPIIESVFILLIINNNKPVSIIQMIDQLYDHWGTQIYLKSISEAMLQKMIASSNLYYIKSI